MNAHPPAGDDPLRAKKSSPAHSSKKPTPLSESPRRPICPICGKPTYSAAGVHPQCSMTRENATLRAARKAAEAEAAALAPVPAVEPTPATETPGHRT